MNVIEFVRRFRAAAEESKRRKAYQNIRDALGDQDITDEQIDKGCEALAIASRSVGCTAAMAAENFAALGRELRKLNAVPGLVSPSEERTSPHA